MRFVRLLVDDQQRGSVALVHGLGPAIDGGGAQAVDTHTLAVLGEGNGVDLALAGGGRLMIAVGRPIGEPVVRHGPFVMNTRQKIQQAIEDFQGVRF